MRPLTTLLVFLLMVAQTSAQNPLGLRQLVLISSPAGADVFIDGGRVGTTPYAARLAPGNYRVRVSRKGYALWEQEIDLREDRRVLVTLSGAVSAKAGSPEWLRGTLGGLLLAGGAVGPYFLIKKRSGKTPLPATP